MSTEHETYAGSRVFSSLSSLTRGESSVIKIFYCVFSDCMLLHECGMSLKYQQKKSGMLVDVACCGMTSNDRENK